MAYRSSSQAVSASAASLACTTPTGTASGDRLYAFIGDDAVGSITPNPTGDWQTVFDASGASTQAACYYLDLVAAPAANYTFQSAAGATNIEIVLVALNPDGNTFGAVTFSTPVEASTPTVSNGALSGVADPSTLLLMSTNDANSTIVTPPASMTQAQFADNTSHDTLVSYQENFGEGAVSKSVEWSTATAKITSAVLQAMTAVAGPTIDVQPANATVTAPAPATFSVTASGTGTLTYQWQEDDGGGFANVTDGSPYSGATTDELTIDPTATALDTFQYRCVVTDDNGSTNTDAATLTVNAGPLLDPNPMTATDAGGDSESDLTSDIPLDTVDGQYLELSTTIDGVTLRCAVLPSTP